MNRAEVRTESQVEQIEVLGPQLLESQAPRVAEFQRLADRLRIALGWHYLLDLSWVAARLGPASGAQLLDAGGGTGVMQWWLAKGGAQVTSVDRLDRRDLSARFRIGYRVRGHRPGDLLSWSEQLRHRWRNGNTWPGARLLGVGRTAAGWLAASLWPKPPGEVIIHHADLAALSDIPDDSFEAVVSISSLEHNPPDRLTEIVAELLRVLEPGGRIVATLAAAEGESWLHQPSEGWCYSEADLRRAFDLGAECPSNYAQYAGLMRATRDSRFLRENLAPLYFRSGENGMPWGVWDPQYLPVGVVKVKPA